jgi:hypothetical protein
MLSPASQQIFMQSKQPGRPISLPRLLLFYRNGVCQCSPNLKIVPDTPVSCWGTQTDDARSIAYWEK